MAKIHRLKTWPDFFDDVRSGEKNFEVRKNDRNFLPGDYLILDEWDNCEERYTGSAPLVRVAGYVMSGGAFGVAEDYAVIGMFELEHADTEAAILEVAPPRQTPASGDSTKGGDRG